MTMTRRVVAFWVIFVAALGVSALLLLPRVHAADVPSDFSLQVTPSPLVTTVKPGQPSQLELKIRNAGSGTEDLKIEPRAFTFDSGSGQVSLKDTTPPDIAQWISFSAPKFTVQPGQWFSEKVNLALPKDAGFSYSFALVISRQSEPKPTSGGRLIKGSVAVFTLVNVDRPGATRKLDVAQFSSSKHLYEYLPATLNITLKNSGNSIVQPFGNVFIQRGSNSKTPIATLTVNDSHGYILPGTQRTLSTEWKSGFWVYQTTAAADGAAHQHLQWNWNKLSTFRIGKYTAKLIAVYNDGQRDIPIEGEITFWVFPWRAFIVLIVAVVGLWRLQHWRHKRKTEKAVQRALAAARKKESDQDAS